MSALFRRARLSMRHGRAGPIPMWLPPTEPWASTNRTGTRSKQRSSLTRARTSSSPPGPPPGSRLPTSSPPSTRSIVPSCGCCPSRARSTTTVPSPVSLAHQSACSRPARSDPRAQATYRPAETYDGDTDQSQRRWIRDHANFILANPDMLHFGILPNHTWWARFFRRLRYVIVDEAHSYRGVFGSHVANLMRGSGESAPTTVPAPPSLNRCSLRRRRQRQPRDIVCPAHRHSRP